VVAFGLDQSAARGEAGKLLEQETTLAAATQAQFADQLFVARTAAGGAADAGKQIAIRGHDDSDGIPRRAMGALQAPVGIPLRCKVKRKDY
jgi:hypothetical protein